MILKVSIQDGSIRSYLLRVATPRDGIEGMKMLFDLLADTSVRFDIGVIDDAGSCNAWGLEKTENGILFHLV